MSAPARWLIVVHRDEFDLFQHLHDRFAELSFVEVLVDRRKGERRESRVAVRDERRHGERRVTISGKAREEWSLFRYCLARRAETSPLERRL